MKATLLVHERLVFDDGDIIEIRIWRVPQPVPPTTHGLKYSLFYGRPGQRVVGYDNERGKGDHRHLRGVETPYVFVSIEKMLADFRADIESIGGRMP
jgi:hypothetical protein